MGRTAADRRVAELERRLANEERRNTLLQQEIARWKWLASPKLLDMMGIYPPLSKLFHVLAEAAELQDPSRSTPIEDIMRTQFVHAGENASTSHPEAALSTHRRHRENVKTIGVELDAMTHRLATLIKGTEWEYPAPPKCQKMGCSHRNRKQPFEAWQTGCVGCGRSLAEKVS